MKPGRQSQGGREDGKGRKIFSRSSNNSKAKEKGRGHRKETARRVKLFSLTKRNREKVRRQKLMMMAPYIEIFFAFFFASVLCVFVGRRLMISQHTHTHTHIVGIGEGTGECGKQGRVLKVVLMLMTFHYRTQRARETVMVLSVDKLLNIFHATCPSPSPGPSLCLFYISACSVTSLLG